MGKLGPKKGRKGAKKAQLRTDLNFEFELANWVPAVGPQVGGQTKLQIGCVGK